MCDGEQGSATADLGSRMPRDKIRARQQLWPRLTTPKVSWRAGTRQLPSSPSSHPPPLLPNRLFFFFAVL